MRRRLALRWLIPAGVGVVIFLLIAADIAAKGLLFQFDQATSGPLYRFGLSSPGLHDAIVFVTNLGSGDFITAIGVLNVLVFLARRDWQAGAVFLTGQLLIRPIISVVKGVFRRTRPDFLKLEDFSFPSGHAFGSAVVYGTGMFLAWHMGRGRRWRWPAVGFFGLLIVSVAASRPLFGAHYVSDVLAGGVLGLAYVCVMIAMGSPRGLRQTSGADAISSATMSPTA